MTIVLYLLLSPFISFYLLLSPFISFYLLLSSFISFYLLIFKSSVSLLNVLEVAIGGYLDFCAGCLVSHEDTVTVVL